MTKLELIAREAGVSADWLRSYLRETIEYKRSLHRALLARARRFSQ